MLIFRFIFAEYDLFKILTQFRINFSRQEHQIELI